MVTDWQSLPVTPLQWDQIAESGPVATVFQTWDWHDTWLRCFKKGRELKIFVGFEGGEPFAIAPLISSESDPRVVELIGMGYADYLDMMCPPDHLDDFLSSTLTALDASAGQISRVNFVNIPDYSPTNDFLASAPPTLGFRYLKYASVPCPTLLIRDHEVEVKNLLAKYSMRRPENILRRSGQLQTLEICGSENIASHLPKFFEQHVKRWQNTNTPSRFESSEYRNFFEQLAFQLSRKGWLSFSTTTLNDQPIAYHFGFAYQHRLTWYKPSFDISLKQRSPGLVLLRHLINSALTRGFHELDFTVGDEEFKRRYTNHCRQNHYWQAYNSRSRYQSALLKNVVRRTLKSIRGALRSVLNQQLVFRPQSTKTTL